MDPLRVCSRACPCRWPRFMLRFGTLSLYICQVEDLVVSSRGVSGAVHISAPICSAMCRICVSSIGRITTHPRVWLLMVVLPVSTGALLTFIRDSQWAACSVSFSCVFCTCLAPCSPCWASLSVSACLSQLVKISEDYLNLD